MGKKFLIFLIIPLWGILFVTGCSTTEETIYDLTGSWLFTFHPSGGGSDLVTFIFIGSLTSGTSSDLTRGYSGTYTVDNTAVNIILTFYIDSFCGNQTEMINGTFTSATTMTGTYDYSVTGNCLLKDPWISWEATKL